MSCENYRRLVNSSSDVFSVINPNPGNADPLACPEAADALHDFLAQEGAEPRAMRPTDDLSSFRMPPSVRWQRIALQRLRDGPPDNCAHFVVRGIRNPIPAGLTREHYFVVIKVDNVVYVADAQIHEVTRDIADYFRRNQFSSFERATDYDVTIQDGDQDMPPGVR
jgi:hypothetical protein